AADQDQKLRPPQLEAVGVFEGRQCADAGDEFRRGGQLYAAARDDVAREVLERGDPRLLRQILADRDRPGVVGWRRAKPDQMVALAIQLADEFVAAHRIAPCRILFAFEEAAAIPGVFGIDVDLP